MTRWIGRGARVVLSALLLTLGSAVAAASPAPPGAADVPQDPGASITEVERVLATQLDRAGISGGAVALVSAAGVEARGVGHTGSRDVTANTPFVIGSTSKSFAALAVMQLVDEGLVDLEASVRAYVPELRLADTEPVDDITVRDLLQQTSGLDDLAGGPLLASAADGTPLKAIAELEDAELASAPGDSWLYANANYVLAGLVVERASGLPYAEYLQREVFDPLGMSHTSATTRPVGPDALAEGHRFWFGVPVAREPTRREATVAAGYLISTAADLGRYVSMYLAGGLASDGTRIVSAGSVETLLAGGPEAVLGPWADGQDSRYAMGWFVGGPWGEDAVFHPGNTPDTTAMLALFPDSGRAVAVVVAAGHELPVPGNPFIADRVTRNVVHSAVGQPLTDLPSVRRFYAFFDLAVLLLLGGAVWGLRRARRTTTGPPARHRSRGWAGVLARALVVGLLIALPMLTYGWGGLWTWAPDLALVIAALALLLGAATALRVIGLLRAHPTDRPATADERKTSHVPV